MRLSVWQFLLLITLVVVIFFVLYFWSPAQNKEGWIKRMNNWIFSSEEELDEGKEAPAGQPDTW